MENFPLVSIFMPTYNHERFIEEAVISCINQTYPNIEIVIADDCSTDRNQDILKKLKDRFPDKIKLILNEKNIGLRKNANVCISKCTGEYIALFSGDDVMVLNRIELQLNEFTKNPNLVLCGGLYDIIDEYSKITGLGTNGKKYGKGLYDWITDKVKTNAVTITIKAGRIPEYGFDENLYAAEKKLFFDVLKEDGDYCFLDTVLTHYRRHSNNLSNPQNVILYSADVSILWNILEKEYPQYESIISSIKNQNSLISKISYSIKSKKYLTTFFLFSKLCFLNPKKTLHFLVGYFINKKK